MDIANVTDLDSPWQLAGATFSEKITRSTARRLRRTRQHLGSYRHDLIVSMRVVNNVEKEMMKAEWENWLLDENTRCRQVQILLREGKNKPQAKKAKGGSSQKVIETKNRDNLYELRQWHEEYCGSCRVEQERLLQGRNHLPFV